MSDHERTPPDRPRDARREDQRSPQPQPRPDTAPAQWPDPNERDCDACGHVWFAGERRHRYLVKQPGSRAEDAQVLCELCYHQRLVRDDGGEPDAAGRWAW